MKTLLQAGGAFMSPAAGSLSVVGNNLATAVRRPENIPKAHSLVFNARWNGEWMHPDDTTAGTEYSTHPIPVTPPPPQQDTKSAFSG
jgi:hypothetical protein